MDIANPLNAPLRRKLLALRVWALCLVGLVLSFFLIDWLDGFKFDIPKWLESVFIFFGVLPFLTFLYALGAGGADLIVHFVPEGRLKRFLLKGDRSPETIAKEFGKSGYSYALLPFFLPLALLAIVLVVALIFGGAALVFAAISALWNSVFGGWPSWAIVITFLLIAILLKK